MVISRIKNNRFLSKTPIFTTGEITNFWWIYSRWFYIGWSQTWFLKKSVKFKFWKKYLIKLYELKTVPKNQIAINFAHAFSKNYHKFFQSSNFSDFWGIKSEISNFIDHERQNSILFRHFKILWSLNYGFNSVIICFISIYFV